MGILQFIDHVECLLGKEGGIQFLGGRVNTKMLLSAFDEKFSFKFSDGYVGKGQYFIGLHEPVFPQEFSVIHENGAEFTGYNFSLFGTVVPGGGLTKFKGNGLWIL